MRKMFLQNLYFWLEMIVCGLDAVYQRHKLHFFGGELVLERRKERSHSYFVSNDDLVNMGLVQHLRFVLMLQSWGAYDSEFLR